MDPLRYINKVIDMYEGEGPRIGFRGAGLVEQGPAGVRQGYGEKFKKKLIQKRLEAREKGLIYDHETKRMRKPK